MKLFHATIIVDDRCLDLLLTEDEIAQAFERSLHSENIQILDKDKCCKCWSVIKPPQKCGFWNKILGYCQDCE